MNKKWREANCVHKRPKLTDEEKAIRLYEQKTCYQKSVERLQQCRIDNNIVVDKRGRKPKQPKQPNEDSNRSVSLAPTTSATNPPRVDNNNVVKKRGRKPKTSDDSNHSASSKTSASTEYDPLDDSKVFIDSKNILVLMLIIYD